MALVDNLGESKVTIKKSELLYCVQKNRNTHFEEYATAKEGYRKELITELETKLAAAKAGKTVARSIDASPPDSHLDDYDTVIKMLEMSTADEITISEQQFRQYVMDKWDWMRAFKASTERYSGGR